MEAITDVLEAKTGYDLFKQQGDKLRQKRQHNGALSSYSTTPVILPTFSIEEKVIEKKEVKTGLNKATNNYMQGIRYRRIVNNTGYMVNGELQLPDTVTSLVDNKMYLPRHKKLARDYGVNYLLKLTELAMTKAKPSRWYAKVTSTKNWEQTEEMLIKLFKKIDQIKQKLQGIGVPNAWLMYYVGASDKLSEAVFNRCIELAKARGAKKPPNLLATAVKNNLDRLKPARATATSPA